MISRKQALLLIGVFAGLLALHAWLLWRMLTRGETVLAFLLALAVALFVHRVAHYAVLYRDPSRAQVPLEPAAERRRVLRWSLLIAAFVPIHAGMLWRTYVLGEFVLFGLLVVSLAVFVYRLAYYARRYTALKSPG